MTLIFVVGKGGKVISSAVSAIERMVNFTIQPQLTLEKKAA